MIEIKNIKVPKNSDQSTIKYSSGLNIGSNATDVASRLRSTHLIFGQPFNGTQDVSGALSNVTDINMDGWIYGLKGFEADSAKFKELFADKIESTDITTKNLTVTGSAHFFELIIDKIKAAGGAALFTPADGFEVAIVEELPDGWKLYWNAANEDKAIVNMWQKWDQAICQNFNEAKVGTSHDVRNKYYWSLVTDVSVDPVTMQDGNRYHYIVISKTDKDGIVDPEVGDSIAMLGSRSEDVNRGNAIYISAYKSIDPGLQAPLLAHYIGIHSFSLPPYRKTYLDATGTHIKGKLVAESGMEVTVDDLINNEGYMIEVANDTISINSGAGGYNIEVDQIYTLYLYKNNVSVPLNDTNASVTITLPDFLKVSGVTCAKVGYDTKGGMQIRLHINAGVISNVKSKSGSIISELSYKASSTQTIVRNGNTSVFGIAVGEAGHTYRLSIDTPVISKKNDGSIAPTQILIKAVDIDNYDIIEHTSPWESREGGQFRFWYKIDDGEMHYNASGYIDIPNTIKDKVSILLKYTNPDFTYMSTVDQEDIHVVMDGKDGIVDGYTTEIENDTIAINSREDGSSSANTQYAYMTLYHNTDKVPLTNSNCSVTITKPSILSACTCTHSFENGNVKIYFAVGDGTIQDVTKVADPITIKIRYTAETGTVIDKTDTITVIGVKAGKPGHSYSLVCDSPSIAISKTGTKTPSSIAVWCKDASSSSVTNFYPANPETGFSFYYKKNGTGSYTKLTANTISTSDITSKLEVELRYNETTIDRETINVIKDGNDGEQGDAYTLEIDNDTISFNDRGDGKNVAINQTIKVYLYRNSDPLKFYEGGTQKGYASLQSTHPLYNYFTNQNYTETYCKWDLVVPAGVIAVNTVQPIVATAAHYTDPTVTRTGSVNMFGVKAGEPGHSYSLVCSSPTISVDERGANPSPSSIDVWVNDVSATGVTKIYPSNTSDKFTFTYKKDSGSETTLTSNSVSTSGVGSQMLISVKYDGTLIDQETINVVKDGASGGSAETKAYRLSPVKELAIMNLVKTTGTDNYDDYAMGLTIDLAYQVIKTENALPSFVIDDSVKICVFKGTSYWSDMTRSSSTWTKTESTAKVTSLSYEYIKVELRDSNTDKVWDTRTIDITIKPESVWSVDKGIVGAVSGSTGNMSKLRMTDSNIALSVNSIASGDMGSSLNLNVDKIVAAVNGRAGTNSMTIDTEGIKFKAEKFYVDSNDFAISPDKFIYELHPAIFNIVQVDTLARYGVNISSSSSSIAGLVGSYSMFYLSGSNYTLSLSRTLSSFSTKIQELSQNKLLCIPVTFIGKPGNCSNVTISGLTDASGISTSHTISANNTIECNLVIDRSVAGTTNIYWTIVNVRV